MRSVRSDRFVHTGSVQQAVGGNRLARADYVVLFPYGVFQTSSLRPIMYAAEVLNESTKRKY